MMNKSNQNQNDPAFLDDDEQMMIESLNVAIDAGAFEPSQEKDIIEKKAFWQQAVKNTENAGRLP